MTTLPSIPTRSHAAREPVAHISQPGPDGVGDHRRTLRHIDASRGVIDSVMSEDVARMKTTHSGEGPPILEPIMRRVSGVQHTQRPGDALQIFERHPSISAIAVLAGDVPIGVICQNLMQDVV